MILINIPNLGNNCGIWSPAAEQALLLELALALQEGAVQ